MQYCNQRPSEESDHDLLQRLTRFLDERGYPPHRALELEVEQGTVVVHGRVPSYHMRQIAVECIKRVAGVRRIVDRITVAERPDENPSNGSSENEPASFCPTRRYRVDCPVLKPSGIVSSSFTSTGSE